ncbi:hypothetical protein [Nonomuraea sp. NPDC049725]|uniref:hypothetical protein n=1 Tax=Nonomuraea sp. NPDC049725 TaxID=3154508 RepID=UPI003443367F
MTSRAVIRRGLRLVALVVAVVVVLTGVVAAAFRLQFTGEPAGWAKSTGNDAMWLGHMWVDGRRTEADVRELATRLRATGIKDVYVHSGPFEMDGRLDPAKYPDAQNFVQWMKNYLPGVRVSAWLGQSVEDALDLDDPASRRNVLAGVAAVMRTGYDGIHYNFEPIGDGDTDFLVLLEETRKHTRLLSTSTPQIEPYPGMRLATRAVLTHDKYWSRGFFQEVADRVDQVAVMTYDSGLPLQSLYGGHVARQAELALELVPETKHVFVGAPAYHDHDVPWSDAAESVALAAEGAKLALSGHGPRERFGLALYVDFAATAEDWAEYRTRWLS